MTTINRRNFLKGMAGVGATTVLPAGLVNTLVVQPAVAQTASESTDFKG